MRIVFPPTVIGIVWLFPAGVCFLGWDCGARAQPPSAEVQAAVEQGLRFLADSQTADGCWQGKHCEATGVVGLSLLAFLAQGQVPPTTDYALVIERCKNYILLNAREDGFLGGGPQGSTMYNHGFATLALTQLYGMDTDPRLGPAIEGAIRLIVSAQNEVGGWRYPPVPGGDDITVTGCQLMALRAARDAGFDVPELTIEKGIHYLKTCQNPDGGFAYRPQETSSNVARTSVGVLLLCLTGAAGSEEVRRGALFLLNHDPNSGSYPYYTAYYLSQATYQLGEEVWERCWPAVRERLLREQMSSGAWSGSQGGPAYCTAMALLALETEWHYLPIYQR